MTGSDKRLRPSRAWAILKTVARKFVSDNGFFLSSALAFNLLLYFVPFSLLLVALLGYTVLDSERAVSEVQSALRAFLPRSQEALAENLQAVVANRGLLGTVGFASFLMFSTFLFGSVRTVLNQVFQVRQERSFMRGLGVDLLMVGFTALLSFVAVGATWFITVAGTFADRYSLLREIAQPGLELVAKLFGTIATVCLFYVLYRFAPAKTLSSWALATAAITATILFQLAKWGFGWYVTIAQRNVELYGALAGLLFLFTWLYYASAVFILGAEIGWAYDTETSSKSTVS